MARHTLTTPAAQEIATSTLIASEKIGTDARVSVYDDRTAGMAATEAPGWSFVDPVLVHNG